MTGVQLVLLHCIPSCQLSIMSNEAISPWPIETRCTCGKVGLCLLAKPLSMFLCTCLDCQKSTGTGHAPLALFRKDNVSVEGETSQHSVTAASGSKVTRHFCPTCGTPIFGETERQPMLRLVPAGIFEQSEWFKPGSVIFHRSHNHWDLLPAHLPTFSIYKENQNA